MNGAAGHGVRISATPLLANGVLYVSSLDNVWAVDARSGRELWRYYRESIGNMPRTGNRGVGYGFCQLKRVIEKLERK